MSMLKTNVYNQEGQVVSELELNSKHFGVPQHPALVHEVVVAQQANARRSIAHTKTRGEVRGGGKKPWRQKGTGRARQGSIRSPQWVGGGITFGPRAERNFSVKVNRKAKRKALFMALSDRVEHHRLLVLDSFTPVAPKTKEAVALFARLPVHRKTLAVIPASDPTLLRMVRNLQEVKLVTVNTLNLVDVLAHPTLVFWKEAIAAFEKLYRTD